MLELSTYSKTASYLSAPVTATSADFIPTGLSLSLAANSIYHVTFVGYAAYDTDAIRYQLSYSGSLVQDKLYVTKEGGLPSRSVVGTAVPELTSNLEVLRTEGLLVTGTAGILTVEICKYFDFTATDSSLEAGSYLLCRRT